MKKLYIAPQAEIMETMTENIMVTHSNDYVDAKENSFDEEEDTALDRIKNLEFPHIWEDEDED